MLCISHCLEFFSLFFFCQFGVWLALCGSPQRVFLPCGRTLEYKSCPINGLEENDSACRVLTGALVVTVCPGWWELHGERKVLCVFCLGNKSPRCANCPNKDTYSIFSLVFLSQKVESLNFPPSFKNLVEFAPQAGWTQQTKTFKI